ncbi:30S ribosomal protein S7 [subsurface metagenome]
MPRRKRIFKRKILPDPKYNSLLVAKFVNCLMLKGKKSLARSIFYEALEIVGKKSGQDPLSLFKRAMENARPLLEVRPRRVGGATYQIPGDVRPERGETLARRWIINFARQRKEHTVAERLAAELLDASKNTGSAVKKKEDTHRMAEANKAFAHYRW